MRLLAAAGLAAAFLAGCGSTQTSGSATLWITRDRGRDVVLTKKVGAGQTAMQALQQVAKVKTSYGGRFVQSIDGVSGDRSARRDWFYFVNGYEADQGAADYTLHPGDVEWWDYRNWKHSIHVPVVVGAFPEPFLHGYGGKTRDAAVARDPERRAPLGLGRAAAREGDDDEPGGRQASHRPLYVRERIAPVFATRTV